MYPAATDLSSGDKLPDSDEIARYCKPSEYDLDAGMPMIGAFLRRQNEPDLSVNRLQFFQGADRPSAVDCVRTEIGNHYQLRPNGRFVVLNVGDVQSAAKDRGYDVNIIYTPEPLRPSHSSIVDLPSTPKEELEIAAAFLRLVTSTAIYPAVL